MIESSKVSRNCSVSFFDTLFRNPSTVEKNYDAAQNPRPHSPNKTLVLRYRPAYKCDKVQNADRSEATQYVAELTVAPWSERNSDLRSAVPDIYRVINSSSSWVRKFDFSYVTQSTLNFLALSA